MFKFTVGSAQVLLATVEARVIEQFVTEFIYVGLNSVTCHVEVAPSDAVPRDAVTVVAFVSASLRLYAGRSACVLVEFVPRKLMMELEVLTEVIVDVFDVPAPCINVSPR